MRLASRLRTGSLYVYFLCLEAGHGVSLAWGSDSGRKGDGMTYMARLDSLDRQGTRARLMKSVSHYRYMTLLFGRGTLHVLAIGCVPAG